MRYKLSTKAKEKIEFYRLSLKRRKQCLEGFILGESYGQVKIIEDFLIISFNDKNIDDIYPEILKKYTNRILGVVFIGKKKFDSDWFTEDLIIEFKEG